MRYVFFLSLLCIYLYTDEINAKLTVRESNEKQLILLWNIENAYQDSTSQNEKKISELTFTQQNSVVNKNGVDFPSYSFLVGIPDKQPPDFDIEIKRISHYAINEVQNARVKSDQSFKMKNDLFVDVVFIAEMNGINVVKYTICPFSLNNNEITVIKNASIRISFNTPILKNISTDYNPFLSKFLINYSIARQWRSLSGSAKKTEIPSPFGNSAKYGYFKIGDGHRNGNEGTIEENGLYKITGDKINAVLGKVPINDVALLASKKYILDSNEPLSGNIETGVETIPLLRFDLNGNGLVDSNDYVMGYMSGVSDWNFDSIKHDYVYTIHEYEMYRTYWLVANNKSALTMKKVQPDTAAYSINATSFVNRKFIIQRSESYKYCDLKDRWIWERLNFSKRNFRYSFNIENNTDTSGLIFTLNGLVNNSYYMEVVYDNKQKDSSCINIIKNSGNTWEILYSPSINNDFFDIKSMAVTYPTKLEISNKSGKLTVFAVNEHQRIKYNLSIPHKNNVYIFKISDKDSQILLIDTIQNAQTYSWIDNGGDGSRYFIVTDSLIQSINNITPYSPFEGNHIINDLLNTSMHTDYLIITHPDFIKESIRLAEHKKKIGFSSPSVVVTSEIYRLFSGGNTDPSAIRNFISYVKQYWKGGEKLQYAVLMGHGNYDPKKYQFSGYNSYIPVYNNSDFVTDDFFSYCMDIKSDSNSKKLPDIIVGRFPVSKPEEANIMVNKVIAMEDPDQADFGPWRNKILLVADDDYNDNEFEVDMHTPQSEKVNDLITSLNKSVDIRKAYLYEYMKNSAHECPDASSAILDAINDGVAYVNYIGHGDTILWASEYILTKDKHVPAMNNKMRYPLISSYSCNVGAFDKPDKECVSAALVKKPDGGACATISSTVESFSLSNALLCNAYYQSAFDTVPCSIGYSLLCAKIKCNDSDSESQKYVLFGDPSLILSNRSKKMEIHITDSAGNLLDTLKALQKIFVRGKILDEKNSVDLQFGTDSHSANVNICLTNPPDTTTRKDGNTFNKPVYTMPGNPVSMSTIAVKNGIFEQPIMIRKNVAFNKPGVKLAAYAWKDKTDKTAQYGDNHYLFNGTISSSQILTDSTGPEIVIKPLYDKVSMSAENMLLDDHITASLPLSIQIHLFDKSGLDISGTGPDEGLTIEIPGIMERKCINSHFRYKDSDFKEGYATFEITDNGKSEDNCEIVITAKDFNGNLSLKKFSVQIVNKQEIRLNEVFNFPNPFRMGESTWFYFYPSNTSSELLPSTIYVKIYTLSGKRIRTFNDASNGVIWDGRDQAGNQLSPNIYLYQVSAYNEAFQKMTKSKIKKLVIHPPK